MREMRKGSLLYSRERRGKDVKQYLGKEEEERERKKWDKGKGWEEIQGEGMK